MLEKNLAVSKSLLQIIDRSLASLLLLKSRSENQEIFKHFLGEIRQLKAQSDENNVRVVFDTAQELERLLLSIESARLSLSVEVFFSVHRSLDTMKDYLNSFSSYEQSD